MSAMHADGVNDAMPAVEPVAEGTLALIVDDSPFLALHLSRMLEACGLQPRIPSDAAELRALASTAAVIFVELELFNACGFEVARELAAGYACPLVLLTGTGRTTDLQWGLRAGACAVLQRPIGVDVLRRTLTTLPGVGHAE